ncbi:MAG: hypothetical protein WCF66_00520 [Pseudolabrys sp.]|jgi:hypothetical protein
MTGKFLSRQNVVVILGLVMIVCLALTIVTFPVALVWIGQPLGNAAGLAADAFASVFAVAFFAAFALAMADQQSRNKDHHEEATASKADIRQKRSQLIPG